MTLGVPDSAGVPEAIAAQTRIAPYGSIDAVERYLTAQPNAIAAVIVEPIAANMGVVLPEGRHRVVFSYRPEGFWTGIALAAAGVAALGHLARRSRAKGGLGGPAGDPPAQERARIHSGRAKV